MIKTLLILLIINFTIKENIFYSSSFRHSGFTLSPWQEWTKSCGRNCSEQFGYQTRKRDCMYCFNNTCYIMKNESYCQKIEENRLDIRPCYNSTECTGNGNYTGSYGPWVVSECEFFSTNCTSNEVGRLKFTRECYNQVNNNNKYFKCSDLTATGDVKYEKCHRSKKAQDDRNNKQLYYWTVWSDWKCNATCHNSNYMGKYSYRTRINCPIVYSNRIDTSRQVENGLCQNCHKHWGEWSEWSTDGCKNQCGNPGNYRNRTCDPPGYKYCKSEFRDRQLINDTEWEECKGKENTHQECTYVDGRWGEWTDFSPCSVTCGYGIQIKKRICFPRNAICNLAKDDLKQEDVKSHVHTRYMTCSTHAFCPVDGNWSEWGKWYCTVTCGNGVRRRYRQCTDPAPLFKGKPCVGDANEYSECKFDDKNSQCPVYLDYTQLPYKLKRLLGTYLDTSKNSLVVNERSKLNLTCNSTVDKGIDYFYRQSALQVFYQWYHNGELFQERKTDLLLKIIKTDAKIVNKAIIFDEIKPIDSGVHVCMAILPYGNTTVPVQIYSIAVNTTLPYDPFAGTSTSLPCNNFLLTQLISNLSVIWYKNNAYLEKKNYTRSYTGANLFFQDLNIFDSGTYECRVIDFHRNRTWITNRIRLEVRSVNNILLNFTLWIAVGSLSLIAFILYILLIRYRYKKHKKLEEKFFAVDKSNKLQLEMIKPKNKNPV